jgi:hypothetical protein
MTMFEGVRVLCPLQPQYLHIFTQVSAPHFKFSYRKDKYVTELADLLQEVETAIMAVRG